MQSRGLKGFFAVFNNTLFALNDPRDVNIATEDINTSLCPSRRDNVFDVKVNLSNVKNNVSTNAEMYLHAIKMIKQDNIKSIQFLAPRYRLLLDYQLYDNQDNAVVDEAVITRIIEPKNAALTLGLDPGTNELVYRVVKKVSQKIELLYREEVPYGIMKKRTPNLTLYINRIQIQQEIASGGFDLSPSELNQYSNQIEHRRRVDRKTEYSFMNNYLTIYDTQGERLKFDPILIVFRPSRIIIDIDAILNNYFFTARPEDILSFINKNKECGGVSGFVPEPPKEEKPPKKEDSPKEEKPKKKKKKKRDKCDKKPPEVEVKPPKPPVPPHHKPEPPHEHKPAPRDRFPRIEEGEEVKGAIVI